MIYFVSKVLFCQVITTKNQTTFNLGIVIKNKKKFYAKTLSVQSFVNVVHTNINSMYDFSVRKKLKRSCIAGMPF